VSQDYTVRLERVFHGPLDLLLHLVREQEVEIHEIEISKILEGYLAYLEGLEELDIEVAGDFLVMAATLMAIKARSMLPHEELDLEEELDPRDELIQRLLEYRRFKATAEDLEHSFLERGRMVSRGYRGEVAATTEREFDLGELGAWDLLATYSRLMRETLADAPHHVSADSRPLRYYVESVIANLRGEDALTLRRLVSKFEGVPPKEALVGSFCALLELVRLEAVEVLQEGPRGEIRVRVADAHREDVDDLVRGSVFEDDGEPSEEEAVEDGTGDTGG